MRVYKGGGFPYVLLVNQASLLFDSIRIYSIIPREPVTGVDRFLQFEGFSLHIDL